MAQIINGKQLSGEILTSVKNKIDKDGLKIKLSIIQVGDDEATNLYISYKLKRAAEVGINTQILRFNENVKIDELERTIHSLNSDRSVTGFFIQTPLPENLNLSELTKLIDPKKDVDGMTPYNLGALLHNRRDVLVSATALAAYTAVRGIENFEISGKHVVAVGRSMILGKPACGLFLAKDATVTICHSKTKHLKEFTRLADILIVGTGKPALITAEHIKEGAVVIDCGAPKPEAVFEEVEKKAGHITPVPGGIGPLTIACLLKNCLKAHSLQNSS